MHHEDAIKGKHFLHYWPFVWRIHWSPVNSPQKGQWHWSLMFSLIWAWINSWVNNSEADGTPSHPLWHHCNDMNGTWSKQKSSWVTNCYCKPTWLMPNVWHLSNKTFWCDIFALLIGCLNDILMDGSSDKQKCTLYSSLPEGRGSSDAWNIPFNW